MGAINEKCGTAIEEIENSILALNVYQAQLTDVEKSQLWILANQLLSIAAREAKCST